MFLDRVTITGADDSIDPLDLIPISLKYPFVEWGILLSKKRQHEKAPRFPSRIWINDLAQRANEHKFGLSAHLCGRWVRELVGKGELYMLKECPGLFGIFRRFQLNFHGEPHEFSKEFFQTLAVLNWKEFIFQQDGLNDNFFRDAWAVYGLKNAFPLYDVSGGTGISPDRWPPAYKGVYQGYAGGLGPDNLEAEIKRIEKAAGDERVWIDMETKVRSDDDKQFDLDKVQRCLEIVAPFVKGGPV